MTLDREWSGRHVLVTGASGFLGSHLARRLASLGADVHAWSSSSDSAPRLEGASGRIHVERVDLRDAGAVSGAVARARPSVAFHLGAYGVQGRQRDHHDALAINVQGTFHLLAALHAAGCGRAISTGTWAEYAAQERPLRETDPLGPVGSYAVTKAMATSLALGFAAQTGLPLVVLRPFSVFGPGEELQKFVPAVIDACLRGEPPRLTSCRQVRDYLYVDDVVDAYLKAADAPLREPVAINVASGRPVTLRELASGVAAQLGDVPIAFGALPDREQEIWHVQADVARADALLGWRPRTALADGIRLTVEWYAARRGAPVAASVSGSHDPTPVSRQERP